MYNLNHKFKKQQIRFLFYQPPSQETWNGELLGYVVTWREGSPLSTDNSTHALTAPGWGASHASLVALRTHTHYEIRVSAFNAVGAGPGCAPLTATTLEGGKKNNNVSRINNRKWWIQGTGRTLYCMSNVLSTAPEAPPERVRCEPLSAQSIRTWWEPPLPAQRGGVLLGYEILYEVKLKKQHRNINIYLTFLPYTRILSLFYRW